MADIRAAVIGAGNMGRHHVRILAGIDDVDLVAVVDPGIDPAKWAFPLDPSCHFSSIDDLPEIDFAVIATDPRLVQFERLSPYAPRIRDSVVFDLMVHDLDLACWICGGIIATLETSRVTQDKVRRIAISEPDRYLVADSIRQDLSMRRQTTVEFEESETPVYRQASIVEIPYVDRSGEPLAAELRDVLDAIRTSGTPTVSGRDGLRAVELAFAVEAVIAETSA